MLRRNSGDQTSPIGTLANTALSNNEVMGSYTYFGEDHRSTFSYAELAMNYGIPGSPEGHIDGVDIDLKKKTQKFDFHKDISFMGFQTLDIDQHYIVYGHTESENNSSYPSVILDQQIFSFQSTPRGPRGWWLMRSYNIWRVIWSSKDSFGSLVTNNISTRANVTTDIIREAIDIPVTNRIWHYNVGS